MGGSKHDGNGGGVRVWVGGSPGSTVGVELYGADVMSSIVRGAAEASTIAAAARRLFCLVGALVICNERRLQLEARQKLLRRST
jgi:hypothetical protein